MINKYIRITFSNACDLPDLYLSQGWQGEIFLDADINETEEDLFEEGDENGFGEFVPSYRRSMKRYVLRLGLMGLPTIEKLHKLRFFDNVELTTKTGEVQEIHRIDFNHDWQFDEKYFATGELRFDMSQVVEKKECCAAYIEPPQPENIVYGFLYNWYAATDARGLAASGWDVPSLADFETLATHLGGAAIAGGKLKEIELIWWNTPNTGATNEVGFNGRGSGIRISSFYDIKYGSYFLVTTVFEGDYIEIVYLYNDTAELSMGYSTPSKNDGQSLRLVRLATTSEQSQGDGTACASYVGNDGKVYRTVKIGTQVWLADNLAETKYANGDWITGFGVIDDCYLPSLDELEQIMINLYDNQIGDFAEGNVYYSSTQHDTQNAKTWEAGQVSSGISLKDAMLDLRPVRHFNSTTHIALGQWGQFGYVFYRDGDKHYEALPVEYETILTWGLTTNDITGATGTAIGTGEANTAAIVAVETDKAANYCDELIAENDGAYGSISTANWVDLTTGALCAYEDDLDNV